MNHESLARNCELLSKNLNTERQLGLQKEIQIRALAKEKDQLTQQLSNLKETLKSLGAFGGADTRKDMEIKDLKDQIDAKNNQIQNLKIEVVRKVKKITEVEYTYDGMLKDKEKDIDTLQADLKATQDLFKE